MYILLYIYIHAGSTWLGKLAKNTGYRLQNNGTAQEYEHWKGITGMMFFLGRLLPIGCSAMDYPSVNSHRLGKLIVSIGNNFQLLDISCSMSLCYSHLWRNASSSTTQSKIQRWSSIPYPKSKHDGYIDRCENKLLTIRKS